MNCWRCGRALTEGLDRCSACGAKQERTVSTTDIGRELRKLYDSRGAKAVFSSADLIVNALNGLGEGAKKARGLFRMALDAGIGPLYLEELDTAKQYDGDFLYRVLQCLVHDAGMNDTAAVQLMTWLNEMIGWTQKKEMPTYKSTKIIGIDLGGSVARAALIEGGELVSIANQNGGFGQPSVVGLKDGILIAGEEALRQAVSRPEETASFFKTKMGTDAKIMLDGRRYQPQLLSALVLRKLRMDVSDYLGEDAVKAVVTVPNGYTRKQRQAVIDAGKMAGFTVQRVINNTSAVALDICRRTKDDATILICHMGSTSFDVSVLDIDGDIGLVDVIESEGNARLGGKDFTDYIVYWILDRFKKTKGIDLGKDPVQLARIWEAAETAKKDLTSHLSTQLVVPYVAMWEGEPLHLDETLTRAAFNEMTAILTKRAANLVQRVIHDAGVLAKEIQQVVFTGGGRMPALRDAVREIVGKGPRFLDMPDDCVAKGAAILGGILNGDCQSIGLCDVVMNSLGLETAGGVCTKLIRRGTTYPTRRYQTFSTSADDQITVDVHLLEGESERAADNETFGTFRITGIPPAKKGVPKIEVEFDIDASGAFHIAAKDTGMGKQLTLTSLDRTAADEDLIQKGAALVEETSKAWLE